MTHYVIGDLQGCLAPLERLLSQIDFSVARDRLVFAGDLVNRGPQSLETLRFVRALGDAAVTVLGNHDLHLLAAARSGHWGRKDDFGSILCAPDADALLDWLRQQPLAWSAPQERALVLHAGVPPQWARADTLSAADEVHRALTGRRSGAFLDAMYGDEPDLWNDRLRGIPRLRFIVNALTRLRYCDSDGRLHLKPKGAPGTQPKGLMPWFQVPGRRSARDLIVFGHWSTLKTVHWPDENVYGLDTGCVWGGCLSALNLESGAIVRVNCDAYQAPSATRQTSRA